MKKRSFLATGLLTLACLTHTQTHAATPLIADTLKPFLEEQTNVMLGANCQTRLEIIPSRKAENTRTVSVLRFTVSPAQALQGFDFDFFEGPGAPAQRYKPLKVTVNRAGKGNSQSMVVAGYRGGDIADGFVFEAVGASTGQADAVTAILIQIAKGADSIDIAVASGKDGKPILSTRFTVRR